jgi:coenzyme F420-0:L-glutamate ligase / coenzyme F420-1:gamma-L-glutamate ligase
MNAPSPAIVPEPSSNQLHAFLQSRRSIRHFRSEQPERTVLQRVFETAGMAPSAHNRQPWRYCAIFDAQQKHRLAEAMGARLRHDRSRDGDSELSIETDVARSYRRITEAPVIIAVAFTMADMDRYADAARSGAELVMAVQSTAMATQNLLLAAHAEGLGTCWMCAPLFCPNIVREVLNLPDDWEPQSLITLGYPMRPGRRKDRLPMDAFIQYRN